MGAESEMITEDWQLSIFYFFFSLPFKRIIINMNAINFPSICLQGHEVYQKIVKKYIQTLFCGNKTIDRPSQKISRQKKQTKWLFLFFYKQSCYSPIGIVQDHVSASNKIKIFSEFAEKKGHHGKPAAKFGPSFEETLAKCIQCLLWREKAHLTILLFEENMCYLKNLESERKVDFDQLFSKDEEPSAEGEEQEEANVLIPCAQKQMNANWSAEQQMLVNLFDLIEKNNSMISALGKALSQNSEQLEKSSIQTESTHQMMSSDHNLASCSNDLPSLSSNFDPSLRSRLFGNRRYKYSMRLASQFSPILYKERNFNLNVELIDQEGKLVRNCNMINLCFAVATNGGQWIHQNRVGDPFLKGKTEVELYNGEASFAKIYARDVSRSYQDGKVNLVVYPKPSTLVYSNLGSFEISIDSKDIEPLILEDISIKAKKKD